MWFVRFFKLFRFSGFSGSWTCFSRFSTFIGSPFCVDPGNLISLTSYFPWVLKAYRVSGYGFQVFQGYWCLGSGSSGLEASQVVYAFRVSGCGFSVFQFHLVIGCGFLGCHVSGLSGLQAFQVLGPMKPENHFSKPENLINLMNHMNLKYVSLEPDNAAEPAD